MGRPLLSTPKRNKLVQGLVGACAVIVAISLGLSAWTFVRQSQADTIRQADVKAQNTTKVASCFTSVASSPAVIGALNLIDTLATNSIKANNAAIKEQPDSPLTATRKASLERLIPARRDLRKLIRQSKARIPKVAACFQLAAQLGVDPAPFQPKKGRQ